MAPIKLIGIDMDGTLLTPDKTLTPHTLRVLKDCKEAGVRACLCTGRNMSETQSVLSMEAELDDLCVLTNGASIMNRRTGASILQRRINPAVVDPMLRLLVEDCLSASQRQLSATGMYQTHLYRECMDPRRHGAWIKNNRDTHFIHDTLEEFIEGCKADIQRIVYSVPFEQKDRVLEMLRPVADLDVTSAGPWHIEIIPKGIHKGEGLSKLADHYGIARESVMAIGDGFNDTSMIRWAGLGIAMGNAVDGLKSIADAVVESNAADGFAKAVWQYALA